MSVYHDTAAAYVDAWDAGDVVYTVDTSGLGMGFEEPVQVLAVEVMRACLALDHCTIWRFDRAFTLIHWTLRDQMPRMSPQQLQHCRWLAWAYLTRGPAALIHEYEQDGLAGRVMALRPPKRTPPPPSPPAPDSRQ